MPSPHETDFYPEIIERIRVNLTHELPSNFAFAARQNDFLPDMISEIEHELNGQTAFSGHFIPRLKLDILVGVKSDRNSRIALALFEVKYGENLRLMDYSQLVGYLQVARRISVGGLLLVKSTGNTSGLSNDLNEIIALGALLSKWELVLDGTNEAYSFATGISFYIPRNGITWGNAGFHNFVSMGQALAEETR